MSLSKSTKEIMVVAFANKKAAEEVATALDAAAPVTVPVAATVAAVSAPNATDDASAIVLANANKAAINAVIASLKAAGLMAS